ncbi:MAG: AsmA family protein, partial [Deltaproteobacteria bacterium]|nr:AsmA family protein [Deltaproteobacteria bacterium]
MRRFFKSLAILLLAFLTILIISTIILRRYFPPERIKGILLAEAEKAIGRRVSVGEVGISLLHGIDISDIYIGENRSYGDIPFVKVKRVTVGYGFSEIFQKRIVFNRITVEQPELYIRAREGKLALSDLMIMKKPPLEERPTGPTKPFPLTVLLKSCEVRGINLFYDAEDAKGSIKGINISLNGDFYPFRGINVKVSSRDEDNIGISAKGLTLNTGLLTDMHLALKGTDSFSLLGKVRMKGLKAGINEKRLRPLDINLGLDLTGEMNGGAEIKRVSVVVGKGSSFNLSGSIRELKGLKGVDIKVTGESDLAEVSKIAAEFMPIPVSGSFNIAGIRVEGDVPASLKVKSNISLNGVKVSHKGINLQVDGSIKAEANSRGDVTLSGMRLNLNNAVTVEASANASKWGKGKVSGRAHVVVDNGKSLALLPEEILKKIGKVGISGMTKVDMTGGRGSEKGALKVNISGMSDVRNLSAGPISVDETAVN